MMQYKYISAKALVLGLALACTSCDMNPENAFKTSADENPTECQVTITNGLVTLHEEPSDFSQEIIRVPPSTYEVSLARKFTWKFPMGEKKTERWLKIQVGSREGWVKDHTWAIARKSDGCP